MDYTINLLYLDSGEYYGQEKGEWQKSVIFYQLLFFYTCTYNCTNQIIICGEFVDWFKSGENYYGESNLIAYALKCSDIWRNSACHVTT